MTRLDALRDLLAKVEAGWFDATDTRAARFNDFYKLADIALGDTRGIPALAWDVYGKRSLDAAKALHDAVLPGWAFVVTPDSADLWRKEDYGDPFCAPYSASSGDPARSWLAAIIKALIDAETD